MAYHRRRVCNITHHVFLNFPMGMRSELSLPIRIRIPSTNAEQWVAMSNDEPQPPDRSPIPSQVARPSPTAAQETRGLFSIPPPLKRIFDKFPLVTYPANAQPSRARPIQNENVLYIFTTKDDARQGRPSFNPSCLKWQVSFRISRMLTSHVVGLMGWTLL